MQVNPWLVNVGFNNATTGMLYPPENMIGDNIYSYDNRYLRILNFSYDSDQYMDNVELPFRKYVDAGGNMQKNDTAYG